MRKPHKQPFVIGMAKNMPKYLELVNWIQEQIDTKKLLPGQKLYSENELSEMFGLSRQTVRHAISVLERDDMLRRVQGSGTYINQNPAENLAGRNRIAVIMTYVCGHIFPRMIYAIENMLSQKGYSVQIAFTNNLFEREREILEDILERDEVAGIIMEATKSALPNPNFHFIREITKKKIPILFINSFYPELSLPHVSMDDKKAGKIATQYLIGKGHRKIAGIFKLDDGQGRLRYTGFMEALNEAGLVFDESKIIWVDTEDISDLSRIVDKLKKRTEGCTGLVTYNDEVALGLLKVLKEEKIRVPEDLSIASIDDSELAVLGDVKLTSVPHPMEKLGEKAVCNLVEMIRNPRFDGNYEFDVHVVERDSVKELKS